MQDTANRGDLSGFIPLVRTAVRESAKHGGTLFAVVAVRLVPFYVLLWFFPVRDASLQALAETLVTVPCVAALVRFAWETADTGATPRLWDAVLGASPLVTLKLLGTDLLLVAAIVLFAELGPTLFFGLLFLWNLMNLVTDQAVVIEGRAFFKAVSRSVSLVGHVWPLSVALLFLLSVPDMTSVVLYSAMGKTVWRECVTRGITVVMLPFSAVLLTRYYRQLTSTPA